MPALWLVIPLVLSLSFIEGIVGRPFYPMPSKVEEKNRLSLQSFRPYNIAHRGSNGEIPEETAEAYMRAIEEGADFIETDILATKDGKLICFHDVILDETTDIANHKEFVNRKRTYEVQGENITGWFVVDFTLEELKSLRVRQRYAFRDQQYNGMFSIITFEEFIAIALDAKRVVGIYPEIKNPVLINQHVKWADGKKFEDKFVEILLKYGYKGAYKSADWIKQPVFIQSFAPTSLIYARNLTDSPKVFLIADINIPTQDTNQVHPYTYRNENQFLHLDFHQDPYVEYAYWINQIEVDGLFTDFTGSLHQYQEWTASAVKDEKNASRILDKIASLISSIK